MENSACDVKQLSISLCNMVTEYNGYSKKLTAAHPHAVVRSFNSWQAPAVGVFKINFDTHVGPGMNCGLGIVIRDDRGKIIVTGTRRVIAN